MKTLVKGARLLGGQAADLLLDGDRIVEVGSLEPDRDTGVVDADGLVALPGLVDLHVHLREPGREDAETVATGAEAAAAGGFTAILAMANTTPVTDTAEAANHVYDLGRADAPGRRPAGRRRHQGPRRRGAGRARASWPARGPGSGCSPTTGTASPTPGSCAGRWSTSRRSAASISQHAQDPRLAGPDACAHESELSGRLGLPGWPGIAEESIVARDVMLARHTGSRVHIAHVSTAGSVEVIRWAKAQGIDVTAEVTPHHLLLTHDLLVVLRPGLEGQPAAAARGGRPRAARGARRRHHRRGRHRPRAARAARQGARLRRRVARDARAGDGARRGQRGHGPQRAARLGRRRARHVGQPGPDRPARGPRPAAGRRVAGQPHAGRPHGVLDRRPRRLALAVPQQPLARPRP